MNTNRMSDTELYSEAENIRRRINGRHVGDDKKQQELETKLKSIEAEMQERERRNSQNL